MVMPNVPGSSKLAVDSSNPLSSHMSDTTTNSISLPPGLTLGNYKITSVLDQGGFGITYLAEDKKTHQKLVIKESMPDRIAQRNTRNLRVGPASNSEYGEMYDWATKQFINEAYTLSKLNHPNIVRVYRAFQALGTAYYVMPYISGLSLGKTAPPADNISEEWLGPILRELLAALIYLHSQNILHRDIKPANILMGENNKPILIDFGSARDLVADHSATVVESKGYTPIEQMQRRGNRGPWTDIYALGATCYTLITGKRPERSLDRINGNDPCVPLCSMPELKKRFSQQFLSSIDKALSIPCEKRWQNAQDWLNHINGVKEKKPVNISLILMVIILLMVAALIYDIMHNYENLMQQVMVVAIVGCLCSFFVGKISLARSAKSADKPSLPALPPPPSQSHNNTGSHL